MTRPISARIKESTLGMLEMERANGLKTNRVINDALCMYLEFLDLFRQTRGQDVGLNNDEFERFLRRWHMIMSRGPV